MSLEVGPRLLVSLLLGFDYSIHSFNSEIIQQLLITHISKIHDNQAIQRIPIRSSTASKNEISLV